MTNNTRHADNHVSINVEFDPQRWDAMTGEQRQAVIDALHMMMTDVPEVMTWNSDFTGREWAIDSTVEDDRGPVWSRPSDTHGTIYVEFSHTLRWEAYTVRGLLAESRDGGMILSGATAEEVMNLTDRHWN